MVFACGKDHQTTVDKHPNSMFVAMQTQRVYGSVWCIVLAAVRNHQQVMFEEKRTNSHPNNASPSQEYQQLSKFGNINLYQQLKAFHFWWCFTIRQ